MSSRPWGPPTPTPRKQDAEIQPIIQYGSVLWLAKVPDTHYIVHLSFIRFALSRNVMLYCYSSSGVACLSLSSLCYCDNVCFLETLHCMQELFILVLILKHWTLNYCWCSIIVIMFNHCHDINCSLLKTFESYKILTRLLCNNSCSDRTYLIWICQCVVTCHASCIIYRVMLLYRLSKTWYLHIVVVLHHPFSYYITAYYLTLSAN